MASMRKEKGGSEVDLCKECRGRGRGRGMGMGGDWWAGRGVGVLLGRAGGALEDKGVSGRRGGRGGRGEEWGKRGGVVNGIGSVCFCYVLNVSGRMIIGR
jgi:hypothetical protein